MNTNTTIVTAAAKGRMNRLADTLMGKSTPAAIVEAKVKADQAELAKMGVERTEAVAADLTKTAARLKAEHEALARMRRDAGKAKAKEAKVEAKAKLPKVAKVLAKKAAAKAKQPELSAESKAARNRAMNGSTPAEVEKMLKLAAEGAQLTKAQAQMAEDGCPAAALSMPVAKRGKGLPPLAGGAKLPSSSPGRELAVPTKTPQTKAEAEKAARKLGLSLDGKAPRKAGAQVRKQYAWKDHEAAALKGTMPPKLDFSAETHTRFRPTLAKIEAAAKARDIKALNAIKINPVSSSPKAMIRWRDMNVAALKASSKSK